MLKFIKDSIREFKHVVWPTSTETKNYFYIVLTILVLFGFYLFVASNVFTKVLLGVKGLVNPNEPQIEISDITTEEIMDTPTVLTGETIDGTIDTLSGASAE